mmetsp:Transcript_39036/g.83151  ORF Transcript_39036/g.83151 Transcript_39036/m.83151 type:complete len:215 (+) Transcript_39036:205-849(+)
MSVEWGRSATPTTSRSCSGHDRTSGRRSRRRFQGTFRTGLPAATDQWAQGQCRLEAVQIDRPLRLGPGTLVLCHVSTAELKNLAKPPVSVPLAPLGTETPPLALTPTAVVTQAARLYLVAAWATSRRPPPAAGALQPRAREPAPQEVRGGAAAAKFPCLRAVARAPLATSVTVSTRPTSAPTTTRSARGTRTLGSTTAAKPDRTRWVQAGATSC